MTITRRVTMSLGSCRRSSVAALADHQQHVVELLAAARPPAATSPDAGPCPPAGRRARGPLRIRRETTMSGSFSMGISRMARPVRLALVTSTFSEASCVVLSACWRRRASCSSCGLIAEDGADQQHRQDDADHAEGVGDGIGLAGQGHRRIESLDLRGQRQRPPSRAGPAGPPRGSGCWSWRR